MVALLAVFALGAVVHHGGTFNADKNPHQNHHRVGYLGGDAGQFEITGSGVPEIGGEQVCLEGENGKDDEYKQGTSLQMVMMVFRAAALSMPRLTR